MSRLQPKLVLEIDIRNPGQFFACCGMLELAQRLWPGTEGCFASTGDQFALYSKYPDASLGCFLKNLRECKIFGLNVEERTEREELERKKRELRKKKESLPEIDELRRKQLGEQARTGPVRWEEPFGVVLDWWQTEGGEEAPKTWAGRQEIHRVARAAQDSLLGMANVTGLFDHADVLRAPAEYCEKQTDRQKSVEPFYFDARRFSHPLDTGFSLDVQDADTVAHPAVELLCLVGLQRFRPSSGDSKWSYEYWAWTSPLNVVVAAGVSGGAIETHARIGYRFPLHFRDNQKRYKAFGFASLIGG